MTNDAPLDVRHLVLAHCDEFPLATNGVSTVARRLFHEHREAGHHARLIYLCKKNCGARESVGGFPIDVLPFHRTEIAGRVVKIDQGILDAITANSTEETIVHIHGGRDTALVSLTRHLRRHGVRYVMTIHGRYSHVFDDRNRIERIFPAAYLTLVERRALEGARFIHVLTKAEESIVRRVAPRARCEVIPNAAYGDWTGIDDAPKPPDHRARTPVYPRFGFCGRYAIEHKGLDLLVGGFAEYCQRGGRGTLTLIGSGPGRAALDALARSLDLKGALSICGPLFGNEKKRALLAWDFFVMCSRFEGLPIAGLEAALVGLPLIATTQTGLFEYVDPDVGGIVINDLSSESVAESLSVAESMRPDEWQKMSLASFHAALAVGDWTSVAARLALLYRRPSAQLFA